MLLLLLSFVLSLLLLLLVLVLVQLRLLPLCIRSGIRGICRILHVCCMRLLLLLLLPGDEGGRGIAESRIIAVVVCTGVGAICGRR